MWILALVACGPRASVLVDPMCAPPVAAIVEPADGDVLAVGEPTTFKAYIVDDCGSGDLRTMRFDWASSVFGRIAQETVISETEPGAVEMTTPDLTVGEHTITLEVTDDVGAIGSASIAVTVAEDGG
jgi:hypothetical protein